MRRPHRTPFVTSRTFAFACVAYLSLACGDTPPATRPEGVGALEVSIQTSGDHSGVEDFVLMVDSNRQTIGLTQTLQPLSARAGMHVLGLEHVSENCVVHGENPRRVQVPVGQILRVDFWVECFETGIAVTTHSSGPDVPDNYQVILQSSPLSDDVMAVDIGANDSTNISPYPVGAGWIRLDIHADHCTIDGPGVVTVVARQVTSVHFEVTCRTPERKDRISYVTSTREFNTSTSWIRLVYPDGSGDELLARGMHAAWSPDRTKLLVSDTECSYDLSDIDIRDCTGGLVMIDAETRRSTPVRNGDDAFESTFAPDGNSVAFVKWQRGPTPFSLFTLKLDGSSPQELTIPGCLALWHPAWSPDGSRIALTCNTGSESHVSVVNVDGTGVTHLASPFGYSDYPAWSPDGSRIAFAEDSHVKLMSPDGSGVTQLTLGWSPAWSPDGAKIVFVDRDGLYTINADGSHRTRLTTGNHYSPAWRP